jgi:hypothetical protein
LILTLGFKRYWQAERQTEGNDGYREHGRRKFSILRKMAHLALVGPGEDPFPFFDVIPAVVVVVAENPGCVDRLALIRDA